MKDVVSILTFARTTTHQVQPIEAGRANALSISQCERLRNNQWLTDEVDW